VAGHRTDYPVAANWKIIRENFQECYHCSTIHPELATGRSEVLDAIGDAVIGTETIAAFMLAQRALAASYIATE
jgi:phenylpropionate dioxygenase-like ring-hydroxylating dioxygenase large terminal subunit